MIAKFRWHIQAGLKALNAAGVIGLGLLIFSLAGYLSAILPAKAKLVEMRGEANSLRTHTSQNGKKENDGPEIQLATFYRYFPGHAAVPDLLEKLNNDADASGIVLEQGDYRMVATKGDKLDRYQLTLPLKSSSYLQIRKFLTKILAELPAASLDSVTFQRQKIGDPLVESQIEMTLYLVKDR